MKNSFRHGLAVIGGVAGTFAVLLVSFRCTLLIGHDLLTTTSSMQTFLEYLEAIFL